jgi:hypothetical protein
MTLVVLVTFNITVQTQYSSCVGQNKETNHAQQKVCTVPYAGFSRERHNTIMYVGSLVQF